MSDHDDKKKPETTTVEGSRGAITDSSSLFTLDKGDTYKEFWNNVSGTWEDAVFAVVGTPFDRDATPDTLELSGEPEVQIVADKLHIGPASRVLEIGCGVGRLAVHMARRCGHYVGSDISANMIGIAKKAVSDHGLDNCEFHELAEASPLPFDDDSFDAVYAQAVFIHLDREDCYRYMCEAFRILKPGGRAYFQHFNLLNDEGFRVFEWIANHAVTPEGKVRGRVHFLANSEVRQYVRRAGFTVDDAASNLEESAQRYDFPIPTINFDYYLIGVGEKRDGREPTAALLDRESRTRVTRYSDGYYRTYLAAFLDKVKRNNVGTLAEDIVKFFERLEPEQAFLGAIELELATVRLQNLGRPVNEIIPAMYAAVDGSSEAPLHERIRAEVDRLLT